MGDEGAVEIVVRGEAERRARPSRATVTVTVHTVDADRARAAEQAAEEARRVRSEIAGLAPAARGAWSIGSASTYVDRPWTDTGRGPAEHHVVVAAELEVLDTALVGPVVDAWSARDGLELGGVAWDVSPAERAEAERAARVDAVAVAARRARDLGEAIGRSTIRLQRLVDLDGAIGPVPRGFAAKAADLGVGSALVPADVVVTAVVEATVLAR